MTEIQESITGETMTVGDKTYALVQFHFHAPSALCSWPNAQT
jgi:carbonic anhydrase